MAPRWVPPALATLVLVAAGTSAACPASADQARIHTVAEGDTLQSIAEQYGVELRALIVANGLEAEPDLLSLGAQLVVPGAQAAAPEQRAAARPAPPRTHVVEPGETLGDIAWRFEIDVRSLMRANAIDDPDLVAVGARLVMPGSPLASPPTATPTPAPAPTAAPTPSPARAPERRSQAAAPNPAPPEPAPRAAASGQAVMALVTGYALGAGASSTRTASGATTHWGTVAADTRLYPFGTRLRIEGFPDDMVFVVEDTGSAVRGNVFDVWFPDASAARAFGGRSRRVTILP
jgi:3D (Asp-Asp-Asp) domain-containing protein/LysM repeat protein